MRMSEQINDVAAALAKAQAEIKGAVKDSLNPHFKSKYADLASVWDACREPITKHGLSVVQTLGTEGEGVRITTMLLHASGQWIADDLIMPAGNTPQTAGSAITYGRRYALAAMVGVAPEDDDANLASAPKPLSAAPAGYVDWWTDMQAAADTGMDALQAAWKASRADLRDYTLSQKADAWAAIKAKAAKVAA